jgi:ATP-dependent DNA helicase RecG
LERGRLPGDWTIKNLLQNHSSRPNNPDIANAFFRSGYVESWGWGISKIEEQCAAAGLPAPTFTNEGSDFWVIFRKDIYNKEDLSKLGLNERQIKAVLYVKENGRITNGEYQKINDCSRNTASAELKEMENDYTILINKGYGAGSSYELIAQMKRMTELWRIWLLLGG